MHPGDNWMIHVAVEMIQPGDVLVVGLVSDCTDGVFGDLLATSLKARGARGLILDCGCRDVSTLNAMGFRSGPARSPRRARSRRPWARSTCRWSVPARWYDLGT
jgi:regulator of RNase E activity RraA